MNQLDVRKIFAVHRDHQLKCLQVGVGDFPGTAEQLDPPPLGSLLHAWISGMADMITDGPGRIDDDQILETKFADERLQYAFAGWRTTNITKAYEQDLLWSGAAFVQR